MTPTEFRTAILAPGIAWFREHCPTVPVDPRAEVMLLAIAGQESNWTARVQSGNGPAHGFWQFERLGGVNGVMHHAATAQHAKDLCAAVPVDFTSVAIWGLFATEKGDNLACGFARLLLWSDPAALPALGDEGAAWLYYKRNWRPGAPSLKRWMVVYPQALAIIRAP